LDELVRMITKDAEAERNRDERLPAVFEGLDHCRRALVVATGILQPGNPPEEVTGLLDAHRFTTVRVPDMDEQFLKRLFQTTAARENMALADDLLDNLDFSCIISPEQVILGLNYLKAEQTRSVVDLESARPVLEKTLRDLWAEVKQERIYPRCELAEALFEALEWFRAAQVRPERDLVLAFAVELCVNCAPTRRKSKPARWLI
jgi:hypothetical protein